jgi:hypothetical protein
LLKRLKKFTSVFAYAHRDGRRFVLLALKLPALPPSLLTPHFSSRENRVSGLDFLFGLVLKGSLGAVLCPYRFPAVAPCQRFPVAGIALQLLPERGNGRAGSSPGITCWGMDWPIKRSIARRESTSLPEANEMAMPDAPARPVRPMRCT